MDVLMPQLGETVSEGKITKWFKAAGDAVKPGDNLFEIETDKVSMEVPSTTTGTLAEIRVTVGAVAPVGAVVAVISDAPGAVAAAANAQPVAAGNEQKRPTHSELPRPAGERVGVRGLGPLDRPVTAPQPTAPIKLDPFFEVRTPARNYGAARLAGGTVVTPLARRLAGEAGIDLTRLTGSGPHGRVVARDIEAALAQGAARSGAPAPTPSLAGPTAEQINGALSRYAIRGGSARRHAAHHRDPAGASQADHSAFLSHGRHGDRPPAGAARGGECGSPQGSRRQARPQALGQRSHHQGLGGGAATRARRQCGMGG